MEIVIGTYVPKTPTIFTPPSSASGEPSSTRKSICVPMMASKKHGNQSAATSPSTTQGDLTRPLTAAPRIKPTLTRCRSARQHNPRPTIHLTTRKFCSKDRGHFIRQSWLPVCQCQNTLDRPTGNLHDAVEWAIHLQNEEDRATDRQRDGKKSNDDRGISRCVQSEAHENDGDPGYEND